MSANGIILNIGAAFRGAAEIIKNGLHIKDKQSTLALTILLHVEKKPGISQGDLGKILRRDPMTMSQAVRALYDTGLILSEPDNSDRRVKRLTVTKKGKGLGEGLGHAEAKLINGLVKSWGKNRVNQFIKDIAEFNEYLTQIGSAKDTLR
jgi:DNA-binding MarR family transcriptional regulator